MWIKINGSSPNPRREIREAKGHRWREAYHCHRRDGRHGGGGEGGNGKVGDGKVSL